MGSSFARLRHGLYILGGIFVVAVLGYRVLGYSWLDATWMVVITISSVGYGERSNQSAAVQLWSIAVILFGITAAAYTFGGLIHALLAGEIEEFMGRTRMQREISGLANHTILVGFGRIGRILAADLRRKDQDFVIIEVDENRCHEAIEFKYPCIHGDATDDPILVSAGVTRARILVTALPNDANNVFITLTARNLNPQLRIIARAEHHTSERKLLQAGANRLVMPSTIGAQQISRMITRPHTADLLELLAEQGNLRMEIDDVILPEGHPLIGKRLRESDLMRQFSLLVVAVRPATGDLVAGVEGDYRFVAGDVVFLLARPENIARFRELTVGSSS